MATEARLTPIPGEPGYCISINGDVWSIKSHRYLTTYVNNRGYRNVRLCRRGRTKNHLVHRLVARTFLPTPHPRRIIVNHMDGDRLNNNYKNLEWVTSSENTRHAVDVLGTIGRPRRDCGATDCRCDCHTRTKKYYQPRQSKHERV